MIDVLRIAHLRIAPQEGNLEVGNCEGNQRNNNTYTHYGEMASWQMRGILADLPIDVWNMSYLMSCDLCNYILINVKLSKSLANGDAGF